MAQGVDAVDRALMVLGAFTAEVPVLTLRDIARLTELNKATILRVIVSLEKFGYITRLGDGRYGLGPSPIRLASIYQRSLRLSDYVVPALEHLVHETQETAAFFVRDRDQRVCLFMSESPSTLRSHLREGDVRPLRPSGTGQILEAFDAKPTQGDLYDLVRQRHFALNMGERHNEIASIAAPVFKTGDVLAGAISISGPITHFTEDRIQNLTSCVLTVAARLTYQLGGNWFTKSLHPNVG